MRFFPPTDTRPALHFVLPTGHCTRTLHIFKVRVRHVLPENMPGLQLTSRAQICAAWASGFSQQKHWYTLFVSNYKHILFLSTKLHNAVSVGCGCHAVGQMCNQQKTYCCVYVMPNGKMKNKSLNFQTETRADVFSISPGEVGLMESCCPLQWFGE